ncbi:hypothetical protein [Nocardiopsis sp. CNT312]|uniref:hypothetical protein n=1 Tax=Nocardiopsis sp. CNT312 TaxID=1137268 RepID=UPI0004920CEF|nr:hypothetical protein [Nocardiopsis sp. CNT312]
MSSKLRLTLACLAASTLAATLLSAPPALADASSSSSSCLSVPSEPALNSSASHIQTEVRSDCGAPTVLWLVREATPTQPRTIQERYVLPGTEAAVSMYCRRSGTHTYQAIVWDPNMMFRRTSDTVTLTC